MFNDERKNLPSASGYARILACPGSLQLERTLPPDEGNEDSRSGDRIHAYMAGEIGVAVLDDDEERVAEKFHREEAQLVEALIGEPIITMREKRLWLTKQEDTFSGKPDTVFVGEDAILVEDYKSGWLGCTTAPRNPQLRALVVLVDARFKAMGRPIYVAALLRSGAPSVAKYEAEEIEAARQELYGALAASNHMFAPRSPSEVACRHCRAKNGACPEFTAAREQIATVDTRKELDIPTLQRILELAGPIEKVIEAAKAKAKRMLAADLASLPGWELTAGQEREKINDLPTVLARVAPHGVTVEQFTAGATIAKSTLKAIIKAATGAKGKALDALIDSAIDGCVEVTTTAPSLKRIDV